MLASPGELPAPEQEHRWAFEMKWDGIRAVVYLDGGDLRLMTRNDREVSATYPELAGLTAALAGHRVVLDGEVVAFDEAGRPSFGELQARMHVRAPGRACSTGSRSACWSSTCCTWTAPPCWTAPTTSAARPWRLSGWRGTAGRCRRPSTGRPRTPWRPPGRRGWRVSSPSGTTRRTCPAGARRTGSRSSTSACRRSWSAAGRPGPGRREGGIGSLLLGVPDDEGRLVFAGHVGTGFTDAMLADLGHPAAGRGARGPRRSPTRFPARTPRTRTGSRRSWSGEVRFSEWTRDGRMRHPAWRGLRPDKAPEDVRRES